MQVLMMFLVLAVGPFASATSSESAVESATTSDETCWNDFTTYAMSLPKNDEAVPACAARTPVCAAAVDHLKEQNMRWNRTGFFGYGVKNVYAITLGPWSSSVYFHRGLELMSPTSGSVTIQNRLQDAVDDVAEDCELEPVAIKLVKIPLS